MNKKPKILISGGGTGGHIFPALSIADVCRRRFDADILFVGAEGRMEMERVPAAGYPIKALPVEGFNRKNMVKNLRVLLKLRKSMGLARQILREFKPDIAIGVGGYASGPMLKVAQKAGIPTLLQEQNSYAGVTNKWLAKKAKSICVAYDGMERFFPKDKIVATGNPVRKALLGISITPGEARAKMGLDPSKPTVMAVGGSQGALTINESMARSVETLLERGIQVIWQTGGRYQAPADLLERLEKLPSKFVITKFIDDMATAYAAASLVVSRAGAGTISELELLGKPCILVPSPIVAEDHQTKNARALSSRGAAVLLPDSECRERLLGEILSLMGDEGRLEAMRKAILEMALPDSDEKIADQIQMIIENA